MDEELEKIILDSKRKKEPVSDNCQTCSVYCDIKSLKITEHSLRICKQCLKKQIENRDYEIPYIHPEFDVLKSFAESEDERSGKNNDEYILEVDAALSVMTKYTESLHCPPYIREAIETLAKLVTVRAAQ